MHQNHATFDREENMSTQDKTERNGLEEALAQRFTNAITGRGSPPELDATLMVAFGQERRLLRLCDGQLSVSRPASLMVSWDVAVSGAVSAWEALWAEIPEPGRHDILALAKRNELQIEGRLQVFLAHLQFFRDLLTAPRPALPEPSPLADETPAGELEPITGRYLSFPVQGRRCRVYFEEAGQGIPLVCLHTAGADGRQYRHMLCDPEITAHFRVIAFDMPAHGKSYPPQDSADEPYQLTTARYVDTILAFCDALGLERPALIGCSIGGRIVLELARAHSARFRALIGVESADYQQPWYDTAWLHRGDVHGGEVCAALVAGLIAPQSPQQYRAETLWQYKQSGPGIFKGDLYFYRQDADLRGKLGGIRTDLCPLYLLTGEYDFSCTPDDTERTARSIAGTQFVRMQNVGHFPMSENPQQFRQYLMPVLEAIRGQQGAA